VPAARSFLFLGVVALSAGACASGHTIDYHSTVPTVSWHGSGAVALVVVDQRPEIVDGRRHSNWVGNSRGGFGNPFEVTTADGQSLSANLTQVMKRGLEKAGISVPLAVPASGAEPELVRQLAAAHASRAVVVKIAKWKSDSLVLTSLRYELFANVTDDQGRLLGQSRTSGDEVMNENIYGVKDDLSRVYARAVDALLNAPPFVRAMQPDPQPRSSAAARAAEPAAPR